VALQPLTPAQQLYGLRKAGIVTDFIEVNAVAGVAFEIATGLGRQVGGYLVVWRSAPCDVHVQDPAADTRAVLRLVPSANAQLRIVLL
jgi:hypothetical protein